ncbi:MAG: FAD-binding oxidoreductase [Comamonadaceae bacterium]|nr:FAD-binding oxidoreductase [Comamonadaceae bacterium]
MSPADVIVIGAGIIGAACAHALAAAGLSVHVIDARKGGATNAGMGHLVVMDDNAAELALSQSSLERWHEWGPRMNADQPTCQFTRCGTLWVAANAEEMAAAEEKQKRLHAHGIACELLGPAALAAAEPLLRTGLAGALKVGGDSIVYAPNAAEWLLTHAARPIQAEHAEVTRIEGRMVQLSDGRRLSAGAVLLAAGIDAPRLCPGLPIRPKKGHLAITERHPGLLRHQLVELGYITSAHHSDGTSVAFNLQPRPTGQLLIGSSRQFDATDPAVDNAILARMLRRALDYAPGLADLAIIRTWTGFRAATPDGLPLIGAHPGHDGLWLAVGHEGLGVTTAPATAQLVAAQMTGATPHIDPTPYAASRFKL